MKTPITFDYHYFDDPRALGYQGYVRNPYGDDVIEPWEMAVDFCSQQQIKSAIDLGCAKGFLVDALLSRGIEAQGYDISDYALSFARHLPCSLHDLREGVPGHAEVVIALGVLMYLSHSEIRRALVDIRRASQQFFLFSAHYAETEQALPDPLRETTETREWWRSRIEETGFKYDDSTPYFDIYRGSGMPMTRES